MTNQVLLPMQHMRKKNPKNQWNRDQERKDVISQAYLQFEIF